MRLLLLLLLHFLRLHFLRLHLLLRMLHRLRLLRLLSLLRLLRLLRVWLRLLCVLRTLRMLRMLRQYMRLLSLPSLHLLCLLQQQMLLVLPLQHLFMEGEDDFISTITRVVLGPAGPSTNTDAEIGEIKSVLQALVGQLARTRFSSGRRYVSAKMACE